MVAGNIELNEDGAFTFEPEDLFAGEVLTDYTIENESGLVDDATLSITVSPNVAGNGTFASDDVNTGPAGEPLTGNVVDNDHDPEGDEQTVSFAVDADGDTITVGEAYTLPSGGTITIDEDGSYDYTPADGFVGTEVIPYGIVDGNGGDPATDMATLYLTTTPVPNYTVAENDIAVTPVDTPVSGNLLTNDSDMEGDSQSVLTVVFDLDGDGIVNDTLPLGTPTPVFGTDTVGNVTPGGTLTVNEDGSYDFNPEPGFVGDISGSYVATDDDDDPATDDAQISLTVIDGDDPVRVDPPLAIDDVNSTEQDLSVSGELVSSNDSDPQGQMLTVTTVTADLDGDGTNEEEVPVGTPTPIFGTDVNGDTVVAGVVTVNEDGSYDFDPEPDFVGEVNLGYTIANESTLTDDATLSITVNPLPEDNETFANDDFSTGPTGEPLTGNVVDNDHDPEGDEQTVSFAVDADGDTITVGEEYTLPSGGTITIDEDGSYDYTPADGFVGTEVIPYGIVDGNGGDPATDMATLYLTTTPSTNVTFASDDVNVTPANTPVGGNLLTNDYDPEGDDQSVATVIVDADGDGLVDDTITLGTPVELFGVDSSGNVVPAGTLIVNEGGSYAYDPDPDFLGEVPVTYTNGDDNPGQPASDDANLTISVIEADDPAMIEPPVAINDVAGTDQGTPVSGNILTPNDFDPNGELLTVTAVLADTDGDGMADDPLVVGTPMPVFGVSVGGDTIPAGELVVSEDGSFTFSPLPDFVGTVPSGYEISNESGLTDNATLSVEVVPDPVDDNQTFANDDVNTGPAGDPLTGNLLINDSDPEGDGQTVTFAGDSEGEFIPIGEPYVLPSGGTIAINPDGSYDYSPADGFVGTEVIVYGITDSDPNAPAADMATLYLTTLGENNSTVALDDVNQTPANTPVSGDVSTNDVDNEGDGQTIDLLVVDLDGSGTIDDTVTVGETVTIYGTDAAGNVVPAGQLTLNASGCDAAGDVSPRLAAFIVENDGGCYDFVPAPNFVGSTSVLYGVTDDNGTPASATAILTIDVLGQGTPGAPVAINDAYLTESGTPINGNVIDPNDYDPNGELLTITNVLADSDGDGMVNDVVTIGATVDVYGVNTAGDAVVAGELVVNEDGSFTFVAVPGFIGEVPAAYEITNESGLSDTADIELEVIGDLGNATFASDDGNVGQTGVPQSGNVLANDTDPENDGQSVSYALAATGDTIRIGMLVTLPSGGEFTLNADGTYAYQPAAGFVGTEVIPYTIADDNAVTPATSAATLYLTTLQPPLTPEIIPIVTFQNVPVEVCFDLSELEGDVAQVQSCGNAEQGSFGPVDATTGCTVYTPGLNFTGRDAACFLLIDSSGTVDTAFVNIEVVSDTINVACIARINVTLDDSCSFNLIAEQVLTGELPANPNEVLDIVVQDGFEENGNVIDGCGEYIYVVSVPDSSTIAGFTSCWGTVLAEDKTPPVLVSTPAGVNDLLCVDVDANNLNTLTPAISRCFEVDGSGAIIEGMMDPALLAILSPDRFDDLSPDTAMIPVFTDNCASSLEVCVSDVVEASGDGCGATTITRFFTARVADGCSADMPSADEQSSADALRTSMTLTFNRPTFANLTLDSIAPVVEIEACATLDAPAEFLPRAADYPLLVMDDGRTINLGDPGSACSMGLVSYTDSQNPIRPCPNTVKFQRTFTVVDWCDPTNVINYTQLVKVGDSTGPEITGSTERIFGTNVPEACSAVVRLDAAGVGTLDACSGTTNELTVTIFPDGDVSRRGYGSYTIDPTNGVAEVSDPLPVGAYTFNYTATDECGNVSYLNVPFAVVDGQTPFMVCEDGLNVSLGLPTGTAILTAAEVDAGSADDCSGGELTFDLAYSDDMSVVPTEFSEELNFTCADRGVQFVTLRGTDAAGNANTCWLEVLVELKDSTGAGCVCDITPPVPVCEQIVTAVLELSDTTDEALACVFAADFITEPVVDCSGGAVTRFGIVRGGEGPATAEDDKLIVNCDDFSDFVSVEIYAFGDNFPGEEARFCQALIAVEEGDGVVCGQGGNLLGSILSQRSAPVTDVEVTLTGENDMDEMAMTDEAGTFRFAGVSFGFDYTVQPGHTIPVNLQEVKVSDVVAISRVILGTTTFASGYDYVAADVDQNGRLNVLDMVAIQRVILGLDETYRSGKTWRFVSEDHELTTNDWFEAFPEVYNVNDLQANVLDADFVGIELGNVVTGGRASLDLETEDAELESGQTHTIRLRNAELIGWQGTLRFGRDLEVTEVDYDGVGGLNAAFLGEGLLGVLLREAGELRVRVRAINPVRLSESVELTDELVVQEGVPVAGGSALLGLAFLQNSAPANSPKNILYQNVPNPAIDRTVIEFDLAVAGDATLSVRDVRGRLLTTRSIGGIAGRNQVVLTRAELGAGGIYTYTLVSGKFFASRRMTVVRR